MKIVQVFLALIAAATIKAQSPVFTNCAPAGAAMTVTGVTVTPHPICLSQSYCVKITGSLSTAITANSTFKKIATYLGTVVYSDSYDMCTLLAAQGTPCPFPASPTASIKVCLVSPASPPPAGIVITTKFIGADVSGASLFCQSTTGLQYIYSPIPC